MRNLALFTVCSSALLAALASPAGAGPPQLCVDPCPDCSYRATDALVVLRCATGLCLVDCSTTSTLGPSTTLAPSTTMGPSTTLAPSTTMAPPTTMAPSTTMAPGTTMAPTTTMPVTGSAFCPGDSTCSEAGCACIDSSSTATSTGWALDNGNGTGICVEFCPGCEYTATDALVVLQFAVGLAPLDCSTTTTMPVTTTTMAVTTTTVPVTTTTMPVTTTTMPVTTTTMPATTTTMPVTTTTMQATTTTTLAEDRVVDFTATLDCAQATTCTVPPCTGSGTGTFSLNTDTMLLTYDISFMNLSAAENVSHIHGPAAPGVPAGVQVNLPLGSPKVGQATLTEQQQADMLAELFYVNVHSANCPGGEIRGQIVREDTTTTTMAATTTTSSTTTTMAATTTTTLSAVVDFTATLDCAQATTCTVPPCTGSGTGTFSLNTDTMLLTYDISFMNLSAAENVSHIHGPAAPGVPAGVQVNLPLGSPKVGQATLTEQQQADMLAELFYVNVHSANCPGGEIRGQIVR